MDWNVYDDAARPRRPWVLANMVAGVDGSVAIDGRTKDMSSDVDRALTFIAQVEKSMEPRETDTAKRHLFAWQSFCKALLSSNEFIYVN